jgi:hypothetical protein
MEVRLTREHVQLCRSILCHELIKISRLLAGGEDESGRKFTKKSKIELVSFCARLRLTLIALGMTSRELDLIVKYLGK